MLLTRCGKKTPQSLRCQGYFPQFLGPKNRHDSVSKVVSHSQIRIVTRVTSKHQTEKGWEGSEDQERGSCQHSSKMLIPPSGGRKIPKRLQTFPPSAYIFSVQLYSGTTGKEQACLPSISIISKTQHHPSQPMFLFCSSPLAEKRCVAQTQCCLQALMAALPVHPWQFGGLGSLSNGVTGLCFFRCHPACDVIAFHHGFSHSPQNLQGH